MLKIDLLPPVFCAGQKSHSGSVSPARHVLSSLVGIYFFVQPAMGRVFWVAAGEGSKTRSADQTSKEIPSNFQKAM